MGSHLSSRRARSLVRRHRVTDGRSFHLSRHDPGDTGPLDASDRPAVDDALARGIERLASLQDVLQAQDRWAVLVVLQAMDAAGKDGLIKHVMSGLNPQGCQVVSFKAPSDEERDHDWLWRHARSLPERGRIGIFNRSHYEEVLVARVHPDILAAQRLPRGLVGPRIWDERFDDIRSFERHLARNGTLVLKFFLHLSREEQRRRFRDRLDDPHKRWKLRTSDLAESTRWRAYMRAYEEAIRETARPWAPWHVVPADSKWYTRLVVAETLVAALEGLDLRYPEPDAAGKRALSAARRKLGKPRSPRAR